MEPNNQEEPIDLSLKKSTNSGEPDNPEEPIDLSLANSIDSTELNGPEDQIGLYKAINLDESIHLRRASDSNESSDTNESSTQSINSEELIYVDELSGRFKRFCGRVALEIIHHKIFSLATLSQTYVEHEIRGLQNYRDSYHYYSLYCSEHEYITEILPSTLALWCFNTAIIYNEYYQELVNTVIFLAGAIGYLKMVEKVIEMMEMENYIRSGDRANLVKKKCHKIAVDTIGKMLLMMGDFNPTNMSEPAKKVLKNIIRKHRNEDIQDLVMLAGINTIMKKLNISE